MTPAPPTLGIVAGSGPGVGNGHLARCLALAEAWAGPVTLVPGGPLPAGWADRYRVAAGAQVAEELGDASVVVVDGYALPPELPTQLAANGHLVAVVDDGGIRGRYDADWVIDQNLGAEGEPERYGDRSDRARLLLGAQYAMLRSDVVAARSPAPPDRRGAPRRLLVALGGDPSDELVRFVEQVVTPDWLAAHGLERVDLRGVTDVGAVLATVDLAFTAAGSTVWELATCGVPSVVLAAYANQVPVARRAGEAGIAVDAGDVATTGPAAVANLLAQLLEAPERRQALAGRAWSMIDGRGARRVAVALRSGLLALRPATVDDEELLLAWANDPVVRSSGFDPTPIDPAGHRRWLAERLDDPATRIVVASDSAGQPIGQVRLEADGAEAVLDYSVAAERRGERWAAPMLDAAVRAAFADPAFASVERIVAEVILRNQASVGAVEAADFVGGSDWSHGDDLVRTYTRTRHG